MKLFKNAVKHKNWGRYYDITVGMVCIIGFEASKIMIHR